MTLEVLKEWKLSQALLAVQTTGILSEEKLEAIRLVEPTSPVRNRDLSLQGRIIAGKTISRIGSRTVQV